MKLHRFFLRQPLGEELVIKEKESKEKKELVHQWMNVLKFKTGESLILFNGFEKVDYIYEILETSKKEVFLKLKEKEMGLSQTEEGKDGFILCVSLIKKENFSLILEKCTELGVKTFIPIISDRVEKKNMESFNKERGEKVIIEAVEQSGWAETPELKGHIKLENLLKELGNRGELENTVVCDINNDFDRYPEKGKGILYLLIGPEGGWTENERELFKKYSLKTVTFGKNILRAETAAIIGTFKFLN